MLKYLITALFIFNTVLLFPAHFKLATISTKNSMEYQKLSIFINEVFKRSGHTVELIPLPGVRALISANSGVVDGDAARTQIAVSDYKNLMLIPAPYNTIKVYAYTLNKNIKTPSSNSLNNYSIIYIRGTKIIDSLVEKIDKENLSVTSNADSAVKMLLSGRGDILLGIDFNINESIKKINATNILKLEPPIIEVPIFIALNKKHAKFAQGIAAEIENMKKDGSLQKLIHELAK